MEHKAIITQQKILLNALGSILTTVAGWISCYKKIVGFDTNILIQRDRNNKGAI